MENGKRFQGKLFNSRQMYRAEDEAILDTWNVNQTSQAIHLLITFMTMERGGGRHLWGNMLVGGGGGCVMVAVYVVSGVASGFYWIYNANYTRNLICIITIFPFSQFSHRNAGQKRFEKFHQFSQLFSLIVYLIPKHFSSISFAADPLTIVLIMLIAVIFTKLREFADDCWMNGSLKLKREKKSDVERGLRTESIESPRNRSLSILNWLFPQTPSVR